MLELSIDTTVRADSLRIDDLVSDRGDTVLVDEVTHKRDGIHVYGWRQGVAGPPSSRRVHLEFAAAADVHLLPAGEQLRDLYGALRACVKQAQASFEEAQEDAHEDQGVREATPWWDAGGATLAFRVPGRTWNVRLVDQPDQAPPDDDAPTPP